MDFRTALATSNPTLDADIARIENQRERDETAKWDEYCYKRDHAYYIELEREEFNKLVRLPNMKEFMSRLLSARAKWEDASDTEWEEDAYKYFDKLYSAIVHIFQPKHGLFKAIQLIDQLIIFIETGRTPLEEEDYQYVCRQDG